MSGTSFDMKQCNTGYRIISVHGLVLTYLGNDGPVEYPYMVRYPDGSMGSRTEDGHVFRYKRLPEDHDIVGFAPNRTRKCKA